MPGCSDHVFLGSMTNSAFTQAQYKEALSEFYGLLPMVSTFIQPAKLPKGFNKATAIATMKSEICNTFFPKCTQQCTDQRPCRSSIKAVHKQYIKGLVKEEDVKKILPGGEYAGLVATFIPNPTSVKIMQDALKTMSNPNDPVFSDDAECSAAKSVPRKSFCAEASATTTITATVVEKEESVTTMAPEVPGNAVTEEPTTKAIKPEKQEAKMTAPKPSSKCYVIKNMPGCDHQEFVGKLIDDEFSEGEYKKALTEFYGLLPMVATFLKPSKIPKGFNQATAIAALKTQICNTFFPKCTEQCTEQRPCRSSIQAVHDKYIKGLIKEDDVKKVLPGGELEPMISMFIPDKSVVKVMQKALKLMSDPKNEIYSDEKQCSSPESSVRKELC